jgi:hypothetical protein
VYRLIALRTRIATAIAEKFKSVDATDVRSGKTISLPALLNGRRSAQHVADGDVVTAMELGDFHHWRPAW